MKVVTVKSIVCAAVCATVLLPIRVPAQNHRVPGERPQYSVIIFGTLGGTFSETSSVNRQSVVGGDANLPGDKVQHATLWLDGRTVDLGTLGGPNSKTWALSDSGDVMVAAETSTPDPLGENFCGYGTGFTCLPVLWHRNKKIVLPTLGGNNAFSETVNDRGQAAGYAETAHPDPNCVAPQVLPFVAVVWEPTGQVHRLPSFPGDRYSAAIGINNRGEAVGPSGTVCQASFAAARHAVLWRDGKAIDLGSLGGVTSNFPENINDRGQAVGFSGLTGDKTAHAFFWQDGVMRDLGTLPGDVFSAAFGINDDAQVAGQSCDASGNCRGFLWQDGVMTDLNDLIPAHSGLQVLSAVFGTGPEIAGIAYDQRVGQTRAVLLIPKHAASKPWSSARLGGAQAGRVVLPDRVRSWLLQRRGSAHVGGGFMRL
jgi:probable HAF family extracellular repeat protein